MPVQAGYEFLLAYKITVPIYDYTIEFCRRWISPKSRTKDQIEQAARSGMTNIAEGNKQLSLASYIKLGGVSRESLDELLKDYLSYARQHQLSVWPKERCVREMPPPTSSPKSLFLTSSARSSEPGPSLW